MGRHPDPLDRRKCPERREPKRGGSKLRDQEIRGHQAIQESISFNRLKTQEDNLNSRTEPG